MGHRLAPLHGLVAGDPAIESRGYWPVPCGAQKMLMKGPHAQISPFHMQRNSPLVRKTEAQKPCSELNHIHEVLAKGIRDHPSRRVREIWKENGAIHKTTISTPTFQQETEKRALSDGDGLRADAGL